MEDTHPDFQHDTPPSSDWLRDEHTVGKLGSDGAATADACNAVRKTTCLLGDEIIKAAEAMNFSETLALPVDCWNHMQCIIIAGGTNAMAKHLREKLVDALEVIDSNLRVSTSLERIMRAAVCTKYGGPENVKVVDVAKPSPKKNEILVKMGATSVASGDARLRRADPAIW